MLRNNLCSLPRSVHPLAQALVATDKIVALRAKTRLSQAAFAVRAMQCQLKAPPGNREGRSWQPRPRLNRSINFKFKSKQSHGLLSLLPC